MDDVFFEETHFKRHGDATMSALVTALSMATRDLGLRAERRLATRRPAATTYKAPTDRQNCANALGFFATPSGFLGKPNPTTRGQCAGCLVMPAFLERPMTMAERINSQESCRNVARHMCRRVTPAIPASFSCPRVAHKALERCSWSRAPPRIRPTLAVLGHVSPKVGKGWRTSKHVFADVCPN